MDKLWEQLDKETKDIISEYYESKKQAFNEMMHIDESDPFSNVFPDPLQQQGEERIDEESLLDTNLSPFENMMVEDE